jgi:hypothetical protein
MIFGRYIEVGVAPHALMPQAIDRERPGAVQAQTS